MAPASPSAPLPKGEAPGVLAIGAHPDDIEFGMAGTLLLLKKLGWRVHYLNVSTGSCGSLVHPPRTLRSIRQRESKAAARVLGAHYHPPFCDDLEILYTVPLLRRLAAVVRRAQPAIVLVPSPQDYMEDHSNTCRLAVTAVFSRSMPNFKTNPPIKPISGDAVVYHALPHGLRDGLRKRVRAELYVDIGTVALEKRRSLAAHVSQQGWLDASQGMNSYLQSMEEAGREVGQLSKKFAMAEGWRRHNHLGFGPEGFDPLRETLGSLARVDPSYQKSLESQF